MMSDNDNNNDNTGNNNESTPPVLQQNVAHLPFAFRSNNQCLQKLGTPIIKITAKNSNRAVARLKPDKCGGLANKLYLAVGAKVMLTYNLRPELGLANGSTGEVVDRIWNAGEHPRDSDLPYCIWVNFPDYVGPPLTRPNGVDDPSAEERKTWVPIAPHVHREIMMTANDQWAEDTRMMIPLCLCWASTIHKAQGQTNTTKVVMTLGRDEMDHGMTYMGFSCATKVNNVGIDSVNGFPRDRITTKLSRMIKVQIRKWEDRRLQVLAQETLRRLSTRT